MSDLMNCGYCGANFWPESGHTCSRTALGNVPARLKGGPPSHVSRQMSEDEIRQIVREEIRRSEHKRELSKFKGMSSTSP